MGDDPGRVLGRRIAAWFIDSLIAGLAFVLVALALGLFDTDPVDGSVAFDTADPAVAIAFIFPTLYFIGAQILAQGLLGWTPGKLVMDLRLVGWDGRPPGLWRAFVHSVVVNVFSSVSCIGPLALLLWTMASKYHQHLGDQLATTYVIEARSLGHLMVRGGDGLRTGMVSVKREEMAALIGEEQAAALLPTVVGKPTLPVFDKQRNAYVVWRPKSEQWLQFDDATQSWTPIE